MAVTISKFGKIIFGKAKFGYSVTIPQAELDAVTDFDNILLEQGRVFFVEKLTTVTDTYGRVTSVTETARRIYAYIKDIDRKDRIVQDMGLAIPGNRKAFFRGSYSISCGSTDITYSVAEGDILRGEDDTDWRVVKIIGHRYMGETLVFTSAIIRNQDLKGTP